MWLTAQTIFEWVAQTPPPYDNNNPYVLKFTSPENAAMEFTITGKDNAGAAPSYSVTAVLTGDDQGNGTTTRTRNLRVTSQSAAGTAQDRGLNAKLLHRIEDWCREAFEKMVANRPPEGALSSPGMP